MTIWTEFIPLAKSLYVCSTGIVAGAQGLRHGSKVLRHTLTHNPNMEPWEHFAHRSVQLVAIPSLCALTGWIWVVPKELWNQYSIAMKQNNKSS